MILTNSKMKKSFTTLLILFFNIIASAQVNNYIEVVYLKNGGIIKGIIIEQVPNEKLKIETSSGNVFVFKFDEIEKITKEIAKNNRINTSGVEKNTKDENNTANEYLKNGYFNATELLFSSGFGEYKSIGDGSRTFRNTSNFYGFRTSHGYQASPHFAFGIGTGYIYGKYDNYIPIYFDLRFPLGKNKFRFSINLASGTTIELESESKYFVNPSIGMKLYLSNRSSFNLNLGTYTRSITVTQQIPVPYGYSAAFNNFKYVISDFLVSLGFSF
jgi:hypothetical protein